MNYNMNIPFSELTFLILDKEVFHETQDEIAALIGDTNLFISSDEDDPECKTGEMEIMIAEKSARGKGLGWEATLLMLKYCIENVHIKSVLAKIGFENNKSIYLFTKLGFMEESRSTIFEEITYRKNVDSEWTMMINKFLGAENLCIEPFRNV